MKKLLSTTALVLTLALAGHAYANDGWHDKGNGDGDGAGFYQGALSKLPEAKATEFKATMKAAFDKNTPVFEQMKKTRDELKDISTAEKFDKGAFLAKTAELNKERDQMRSTFDEARADALGKLTQDERKTLAEAMHDRGHGHHKDGHMGDKPAADAKTPAN